jgi:hypothetical protein
MHAAGLLFYRRVGARLSDSAVGAILGVFLSAWIYSPIVFWHFRRLMEIRREVWEPYYKDEIARLQADLEYEKDCHEKWLKLAIDAESFDPNSIRVR